MEGSFQLGGSNGQREILAGARAHEADRLLHIGLRRIDHHACGTARADAHYEIEDVVGIEVHVKDDNIVPFSYCVGQFVEIGREGNNLADLRALAF